MSTNRETVVSISASGGVVFFAAWLVMLALGDLHIDVNGTVPNLGYLVCLVILAALRGVVAVVMREGEV